MGDVGLTFGQIIEPLSDDEFRSLLLARELKHLRTTKPDRYSTIISWDRLLEMIELGQHPRGLQDVRLTKESLTVAPTSWLARDEANHRNKVDVGKVQEIMEQGFSLVVNPIERYVPSLTSVCDEIRARFSEQTKVGLIATTGKAGAFQLHFDPEDLIILQLEGTKRWRIYGPAVQNPVIGMPKQEPPAQTTPIFDDVLEPGDFLFLPAGTWHHCENGPSRSLHLGIFFIPPTSWHAARSISGQVLSENSFRVPLSRLNGQELRNQEAILKRELIRKIDAFRLEDFLRSWPR